MVVDGYALLRKGVVGTYTGRRKGREREGGSMELA